MLDLARRDLDRRSYTPVLGQFLARAVEGQGQRPLVDVCVTRLRVYLVLDRDDLRPQVKGFLERQGTLFCLFTRSNRVDTLLLRAAELLARSSATRTTRCGRGSTDCWRRWPTTCGTTPTRHAGWTPSCARWSRTRTCSRCCTRSFVDVVASVRASLADFDGGLQQRLAGLVRDAGVRVVADEALGQRLEVRFQAACGTPWSTTATRSWRSSPAVQGWEARDARRASRRPSAATCSSGFDRHVVGALAGPYPRRGGAGRLTAAAVRRSRCAAKNDHRSRVASMPYVVPVGQVWPIPGTSVEETTAQELVLSARCHAARTSGTGVRAQVQNDGVANALPAYGTVRVSASLWRCSHATGWLGEQWAVSLSVPDTIPIAATARGLAGVP